MTCALTCLLWAGCRQQFGQDVISSKRLGGRRRLVKSGIKSDVQRKQKFNFENFYSRSFNYSLLKIPHHASRKQYLKNSAGFTQQNFAIKKNQRSNTQFFNRKQSNHR
jgi:hypothetical protein